MSLRTHGAIRLLTVLVTLCILVLGCAPKLEPTYASSRAAKLRDADARRVDDCEFVGRFSWSIKPSIENGKNHARNLAVERGATDIVWEPVYSSAAVGGVIVGAAYRCGR